MYTKELEDVDKYIVEHNGCEKLEGLDVKIIMIINKVKKRVAYGVVFLVVLVVEVLIALYLHDDFVRPYIGDVLVVVVVYSFARIFVTEGVKLMPLYVFIFAAAVEGLQYLHLVNILGLQNNILARIVIGSTFDVKDIICYGIGCILIYLLEVVILKNVKSF